METIIALLFILLPVIFKLIGKKFEQAGQSDRAERMRRIAEALSNDESEVEHDDDGQVVNVPPVHTVPVQTYVRSVPAAPATVVTENVVRQTKSKKPSVKKPILEEEVQVTKREKIDPKKLVMYSEIMKPKFTE